MIEVQVNNVKLLSLRDGLRRPLNPGDIVRYGLAVNVTPIKQGTDSRTSEFCILVNERVLWTQTRGNESLHLVEAEGAVTLEPWPVPQQPE